MLNRVKEKLPSTSDITKADDIELQEITENSSKSMEDLISQMKNDQSQTDDSLPLGTFKAWQYFLLKLSVFFTKFCAEY